MGVCRGSMSSGHVVGVCRGQALLYVCGNTPGVDEKFKFPPLAFKMHKVVATAWVAHVVFVYVCCVPPETCESDWVDSNARKEHNDRFALFCFCFFCICFLFLFLILFLCLRLRLPCSCLFN